MTWVLKACLSQGPPHPQRSPWALGPLAEDSSVLCPPWSHPCLGSLSPDKASVQTSCRLLPTNFDRVALLQGTTNTAVSPGVGSPCPAGWTPRLAGTSSGRRVPLCWGQPVSGSLWGPLCPSPRAPLGLRLRVRRVTSAETGPRPQTDFPSLFVWVWLWLWLGLGLGMFQNDCVGSGRFRAPNTTRMTLWLFPIMTSEDFHCWFQSPGRVGAGTGVTSAYTGCEMGPGTDTCSC